MKKNLIALLLCVALIAVAAVGATMAYFTDSKSATNTFTVGNVKIDLIESTLHRTNSGVMNNQQPSGWVNELAWSNVAMQGGEGNYYTDEQIMANLYTDPTDPLLPGGSFHKMPYVKNTGNTDAYIRIRLLVPKLVDDVTLNSFPTSAFLDASSFNKDAEFAKDSTGNNRPEMKTVTRDGLQYVEHTFTRIQPLEPGEMTFWNVWSFFSMGTNVTSAQIAPAIEGGAIDANGQAKIIVEADAIQAAGFDSYTAAWTAFDAQAKS